MPQVTNRSVMWNRRMLRKVEVMVANLDSKFFVAIFHAVPSMCCSLFSCFLCFSSQHISMSENFILTGKYCKSDNLKFISSSFWCKQY